MKPGILYVDRFKTKFGLIRVAATSDGLAAVSLPSCQKDFEAFIKKEFPDWTIREQSRGTKKAVRQIKLYLEGKLRKFTLKLDLRTTPFRRRVLNKVAVIPYGKVKTYGEIAGLIGQPKASRAVGSACANNPIPIVIPCHSVVAATGPGGYAGGIKMKKLLLAIEIKAGKNR